MNNKLSVALCQLNSCDDVASNLKNIQNLLYRVSSSVDLVILPENSLYLKIDANSPKPQLELESEEFEKLGAWVNDTGISLLLGGTPLRENGKQFNSSILFEPKKSPKVVYRKIHLFDVEVVGEKSMRESDDFCYGKAPAVIEFKGCKIGLSICYDIRFSELYNEYARQEVDLILVPAAFLLATGRAHWHVLLRARAIESQCFVLAPAQSGIHKGVNGGRRESFGHSLAITPWGEVVCDMGSSSWEYTEIVLDPELLSGARQQIPMKDHRRLK